MAATAIPMNARERVDLAAKKAMARARTKVEKPETLRALEIYWAELLRDKYGTAAVVLPWVEKEQGHLNELLAAVGLAETKALLECGVRNWGAIRVQCDWLPALPGISTLFSVRHRVASELMRERKPARKPEPVIPQEPRRERRLEETQEAVDQIEHEGLREVLQRILARIDAQRQQPA